MERVDGTPRLWRRWRRSVVRRIGVLGILLLLLLPLLVLSTAPPTRPAEEPPPWWHDLDHVEIVVPRLDPSLYEDWLRRQEITPSDAVLRDCAALHRVVRLRDSDSERHRRLVERHCPEL
jgi:hypothetical protein